MVGGISSIVLFPLTWLALAGIDLVAGDARPGSATRRQADRTNRRCNTAPRPPPNLPIARRKRAGAPVAHLFRAGRAIPTLLFWLVFTMNLLSVYFLGSWLTTLSHSAGFPIQVATILSAVQSVGSIIGTLVIGVLISRYNGYVVLCFYYVGAALGAGAARLSPAPQLSPS